MDGSAASSRSGVCLGDLGNPWPAAAVGRDFLRPRPRAPGRPAEKTHQLSRCRSQARQVVIAVPSLALERWPHPSKGLHRDPPQRPTQADAPLHAQGKRTGLRHCGIGVGGVTDESLSAWHCVARSDSRSEGAFPSGDRRLRFLFRYAVASVVIPNASSTLPHRQAVVMEATSFQEVYSLGLYISTL